MNKKYKFMLTSILVFSTISYTSYAKELNSDGFNHYIDGIKSEALDQGYSKALLERVYKNVKFKPKIIKSDKNQPEKKVTLEAYLSKVVTPWKVKKAKQAFIENRHLLEATSEKYGIPAKFIVSLWGIESSFGRWTGNHSVIGALTTMAYEGRREAFFKSEIFHALAILQKGHIKPEQMLGSWAGAMGQCQFMPSSFLAYAQDGNQDGKKDIWKDKADVFASIANYLRSVGWQKGYTWGREVVLTQNIAAGQKGFEKSKGKSLAEWEKLGVRRVNGHPLPKVDIQAWLIQPDSEKGASYLVYNNFRAIMHWNRSYYFALSVSQLADKIGY